MIGGSTQQTIFGDHSSIHSLVTKKQFLKDPKSHSVDFTFEGVSKSKNRYLLTFEIIKSIKIIVWHFLLLLWIAMILRMLASILRIIAIHRSKRKCHTMILIDFMISNVRR